MKILVELTEQEADEVLKHARHLKRHSAFYTDSTDLARIGRDLEEKVYRAIAGLPRRYQPTR